MIALQKCNYKSLISTLLALVDDFICLFSHVLVLINFNMLYVNFKLKWNDFECNPIIGFNRSLSRYKLLKHAELELWKLISLEPEWVLRPIIYQFYVYF